MKNNNSKEVRLKKLRRLQKICTETLFEFDDICKTNNLTYYLAYGTLLGAIRHKGFIPWDDDIDVYMPRADYDNLIKCHLSEFKSPYRINHYSTDYYKSYSFNLRIGNQKVQVKRTVGESELLIDAWMSIFPIDEVPSNLISRKVYEIKSNLWYLLLRFARSSQNGIGKVQHSRAEQFAIYLNNHLSFFKKISIRDIADKMNRHLSKFSNRRSNHLAVFSYGVDPLFYNKGWFENVEYKEFEGRQLPCPSGYHEILKFCYGDYMKYPPIEQQEPAHSFDVIFNEM